MHTAPRDSRDSTPRRPGPACYRSLPALLPALLAALFIATATAQPSTPAFVDDSTLATETLARLDDIVAAGSLPEAARALQRLLDDEGPRLVQDPRDPALFRPVRDAVHAALLARPDLLDAYAQQQTPEAERLLVTGQHARAEASRLLTPPGFEAALRLSQDQLESARFDAAWRTLAQLHDHPLAADPDRAAAALGLATTIAAYLDRDPAETAPALARWAARAARATPTLTPAPRPAGLGDADLPPLAPTGPAELEGIVPTPLHLVALPAAGPTDEQPQRAPRASPIVWAIPTLHANTVYINDGQAVAAHDRFTLRRLWRAPAAIPADDENPLDPRGLQPRRNLARQVEDPTTVTLHDGSLYTALGAVVSGQREQDNRVLRLDADTGRVRWAIDPATLSPELAGAGIRGPIAVDDDTAVVALRKNERARRTIGVYLVGLDTRNGQLQWSRLVGSVGALPYQQQTRSPQAILIHRGAAVLVDEVGLTTAVDTATGRPLWLRRTADLPNTTGIPAPWTVHRPIPHEHAFIAVSPNRQAIDRIDLETGALLASRPAAPPGEPNGQTHYLLPAGPDTIAAVGPASIWTIDPETLQPGPHQLRLDPDRGPFTARVLPAGDTLIAPVEAGVIRFNPATGDTRPLAIDATGNLAAAPGQLLVADDARLRSYLVWDVAEKMLRSRIEADPGNPDPAVTFAELAFRAGRTAEILPAIDLALASLDRAPSNPDSRQAADRLFDVTLRMVEQAQARWFPAADRDPQGPEVPPDDAAALAEQLVRRLGRLADTPEQRVAHLLAQGRQHEARDANADAAATYQQLLADPTLASTPWRGPRVSIRAELEAERRLHALIARAGFAPYQPFDDIARAELAALPAPPDPDRLADIARRFPLSPAAARARLIHAETLAAAGDDRQAVHAGARAISTLRRLDDAAVAIDPALVGRAYGAQVLALARASRLEDAAALVAEATTRFPDIPLLDGNTPIATDQVFEQIAQRLAQRRTHPRLGPNLIAEEQPQLIQGYVLRPLARPEPGGVARARFDGMLVVSPPAGSIAWMAPLTEDGPLREVWSRKVDRDPLLLRIDEASAWVFWPEDNGGWIERIALDDGAPLWTSSPWSALIQGVETPDQNDREPTRIRFVDPIEGRVRADEILVTMDARTIIIVERGGRAAAIDSATGQPLWARTLPISRVHDTDTAAGVFAVGGAGLDRNGEFGPVIATFETRTGEPIHADQAIDAEVRWLRVTREGELIAGLADRILAVSPTETRLNWELQNPELADTDDAWLLDRTLIVRGIGDELWIVNTQTGRAKPQPLETRGRINTSDRVVVDNAGENILLASTDGVCLFTNEGTLVGLDSFTQPAQLMPAVLAEDRVAVLKIERGRFGLGGTRFVMNFLATDSLRAQQAASVTLFGEPTAVEAMDGRILVSAGEATVVLRAPIR